MKVFLKQVTSDIQVSVANNNIQLLGNIYPIYVNKIPNSTDKLISCIQYYVPVLLNKLIHYLTVDLKYKYGVSNTFLINPDYIRNMQFRANTVKKNNVITSKLEVIINTNIFNETKDRAYGYYYLLDGLNLAENKFNLKCSNCLIKPVFDKLSKKMYLPPNTMYEYLDNTIEFCIGNKGYIIHLDKLDQEYLEVI